MELPFSNTLIHKMNVTEYNIKNAGIPGQSVSYNIGQPSDTLSILISHPVSVKE